MISAILMRDGISGACLRSWIATPAISPSKLQSHPDYLQTPGVETNTGSLGQGLPIANGIAVAARLDGRKHKAWVLLGDSELIEGQAWEAAAFAAYQHINNVVAMIEGLERGAACGEGVDVVIFTTEAMVFKAMEAASILDVAHISSQVVNGSILKPVAEKAIREEVRIMKAIVTAEEHSVVGRLGPAVASALWRSPVPMESVGIRNCFGVCGENLETLMRYYGLTAEAIVQAVHNLVAPQSAISTGK